ncbi:MAG: hypothetical protein JWN94_3056 [Betaproteobacteria bacterium]|nr:hypothetical protein [Betaproteobacteria bacterium]
MCGSSAKYTLLAAAFFLHALPALAIDGSAADKVKEAEPQAGAKDSIAYKLTPSFYRTTNVTPAYDVNLRANYGANAAWVGFYQRSNEFQQLRLGYENTVELPFGKVTPSVQYATRGFLGGSLTAEIGERYFALAGFGRTNLKDYFNLNFDPNDMVLLGFGTRALPDTTLSLFQIRDDRLGTGQRVSHLVARYKPDENNRWTLDMFYKDGRAEADPASERVHGTGVSLTWDHGRYFARVASDPHVNFSHDHMVRVAAGFRF